MDYFAFATAAKPTQPVDQLLLVVVVHCDLLILKSLVEEDLQKPKQEKGMFESNIQNFCMMIYTG